MAQLTMEQQHTNLANEARWVKWLLEGLAWVTVLGGTVAVAFYINEGVTASSSVERDLSFLVASWVFGSTLLSFLVWKLLAIAVGTVSVKQQRLAAQPIAGQPEGAHDAVDADRFESLVQ